MNHPQKGRTMPCSRRSFVIAASAACLLAPLTLTGCDADKVEAYVPVSETLSSSDGAVLQVTARELDDAGNAVSTTVTDAAGAVLSQENFSYDMFGAPTPEGGAASCEVDDNGQPTSIATTDANGRVTNAMLSYHDVAGRLSSEELERDDGLTWSVSYDRDGWPLEGGLEADGGTAAALRFVYEITETGRVTVQHVEVDGAEAGAYSYDWDDNGCVSVRHNPDGTSLAYTYQLVEGPSALARARSLAHTPDWDALATLAGL